MGAVAAKTPVLSGELPPPRSPRWGAAAPLDNLLYSGGLCLPDLPMKDPDKNSKRCCSPALFKDAFQFVVPLPRGVPREDPDCRFPSEARVWGRTRESNFDFNLDFDLKCSSV